MYRTVLADDEASVLKGLKNHVDWKRYDIEIVGTFSNGRDALAYIREHSVELLITDVNMPYVDGIELARQARQLYPFLKVLFISGYNDVNYLRQALKLDAVDYIFKSVDLGELDAALTKVVGQIVTEREKQNRLNRLEEQLERAMPQMRSNALSMLLRAEEEETGQTAQDVAADFQFLGIPLDNQTHYAVMVFRFNNYLPVTRGMSQKERMLLSVEIEQIAGRILKDYDSSVCFKTRESEYVLVVNAQDADCENTLLEIAQKLRECLQEETGLEITIGISDRFQGLGKLPSAYMSACEAIRRHYLLDDGLPISVNKYEEVGDIRSMRERASREIGAALTGGSDEAVRQALSRALEDMAHMENSQEQQNFMLFLLLLPAELLTNVDTDKKGSYTSQRSLIERFFLCRSGDEQAALLAHSYEEVTEILRRMSTPKPSTIIQKVIELIEKGYGDHITVASLASEVYLSPTYMCVLFRQQTGKTVNEYITLERIRKAKEILADPDVLLYDVCFRVGYLSPSYFSRVFKKHTGMSPGDYRDEILGSR